MAKTSRATSYQARKGNADLARRARSFYGLMARIARTAGVSPAHVSYVLAGHRASARLLAIALREIARAEASESRRAA